MSAPLLPAVVGHDPLAVTDDGIRTHVECSCGHYARAASYRSGTLAALMHYLHHAPPGPGLDQARQLSIDLAQSDTTQERHP